MSELIVAKKSPEMLEYLLKRRSVAVLKMAEPGPSQGEIETIITAAMRVPDHGKLSPFYFIVFDKEKREQIGGLLREAFLAEEPDAPSAKLDLEAGRFMRAPVVIVVVSRIRQSKIPTWEQILCAGAACQNMLLAANAMGYAAQWLTEWYAYSETFKQGLGLEAGRDHIAGVMYLGTPAETPEERVRPVISDFINYYSSEEKPKLKLKGDGYEKADKGFAEHKFHFDWKN